MSYTIEVDAEAQATIDVLPPALLDALGDVFSVLALVPWSAPSLDPDANPDGAVRSIPLGRSAMLIYLVLEREQRVDVLRIAWAG